MSEFRINGDKLPLNGSSERYDVASTGGLAAGCAAVCSNDPCAGGQTCVPDGEAFHCTGQPGLEPGIIVVIVFFVILLVAIVIVFVLFRVRRGWFHRCLPVKGEGCETSRKNASNGGKLVGSENSLQSHASSRYAENSQLEEMIIRNHIAEELAGQKTSSLTAARPDLIGSSSLVTGGGLPQPTHFADGTMIIEHLEPGEGLVGLGGEGAPELYDLENASSIAPSDSDVIQHYQRFRHGNDLKAHLHHSNNHNHHNHHNHNQHNPHRERYNPGLPPFREGAHTRQSPVSVTGSALSMPARRSPLAPPPGQAGRPSSALAALHPPGPPAPRDRDTDSPRVRASPRSPGHSQGSTSAHSLGSHHSHSSSSSNPHLPQANGHGPPRGGHNKGPKGPGGRYYQRGLTVDEVNRLNARADLKNTASMLEAVSSSSEDPRHPRHHHHHHHNLNHNLNPHHHHHNHLQPRGPHPMLSSSQAQRLRPEENVDSHILLEAPDSSDSDSGANDSFTCSEFEYENERGGGGGGGGGRLEPPGSLIFSRLPEVDEDEPLPPPGSNRPRDGRNSNGDSAGSTNASDEGPPGGSNPLSPAGSAAALDFEGLLNLGPNFDKLVGVFRDIALLPDSSHALEGIASNDYEEYV